MSDFRDHFIDKALDKSVGAYRPEKTRRARLARVAAIAALALAAATGFWILMHQATSQTGKQAREPKPVAVQLLPPPAKR